MNNYTIAVAGTGYVGLSIATLLSQNHKVYAVDIVPEKVELINNRKSPIQDDYIEKYLAEKDLDLTATLDAEAAYESDNYTLDDLFLMSHCKHMIMANSSYSWWAAWLNQYKQKTVICPELGMWKGDFYPDDWIKIRCDE